MTTKLTNNQIAWRAAQDIVDGAYVNLGIGFPEMVARYQPEGREAIFHTENGILDFGEAPPPGEEDEHNRGGGTDQDHPCRDGTPPEEGGMPASGQCGDGGKTACGEQDGAEKPEQDGPRDPRPPAPAAHGPSSRPGSGSGSSSRRRQGSGRAASPLRRAGGNQAGFRRSRARTPRCSRRRARNRPGRRGGRGGRTRVQETFQSDQGTTREKGC